MNAARPPFYVTWRADQEPGASLASLLGHTNAGRWRDYRPGSLLARSAEVAPFRRQDGSLVYEVRVLLVPDPAPWRGTRNDPNGMAWPRASFAPVPETPP